MDCSGLMGYSMVSETRARAIYNNGGILDRGWPEWGEVKCTCDYLLFVAAFIFMIIAPIADIAVSTKSAGGNIRLVRQALIETRQ